MQTRSMKYNLLFAGIPDISDEENTQEVLKYFIKNVLKYEEDVQVAHRSRKRRDGRPRSIVAKFEHRKDRTCVLTWSKLVYSMAVILV